jgi:hypothetical protein
MVALMIKNPNLPTGYEILNSSWWLSDSPDFENTSILGISIEDEVNLLNIQFDVEHAKNIKPEDEVKLYYDILTLYDNLGQKEQKEIYLQKCKNINIEDNFYKNMCNGMNP